MGFIAAPGERIDQPVEMRAVPRLAFDVGDKALGRQGGEHPLMVDLDDVDLLLVEYAGNLAQRARTILQAPTKAGGAAPTRQVPPQPVRTQPAAAFGADPNHPHNRTRPDRET